MPHNRRQSVDDIPAGEGVDQIGRADLHRRGSRQHHLDDVLRRGHAAHADDGDFHRLVDLIHHPHRHREHGGAGHPPGAVGQEGLSCFQIDPHGQQGVDKAHAVGPRVLAGFRHGGDVRDVGAEFHIDRLCRDRLHGFRHRRRRLRAGAEGHAAAVDVGAGDVDLQPAHLLLPVQQGAGVGVVLDGKAADVGHDRLMENFLHPGQLLRDDMVHAGILQAHGVEHPGGGFGDAGGGVAETGVPRGALEGEGAQTVDVVQPGKLLPIAEGPAGGDDGVVQRDAGEGHARVHHMISSFSSTGPSLQIRLLPYFVLQEHPMHAPTPQPMRSSKLIRPEVALVL